MMLKLFQALIASRLVWSGLVVAVICLLIAYQGHLIAFGDARPLAKLGARQAAIGAVCAAWLLFRAFPRLLGLRRQQRLYRQLSQVDEPQPAEHIEEQLLAESCKRTIRLLKQRQFSGGSLLRLCYQRIGRRYRYQLPWYLVLGGEGCGKDRALKYAGLDVYHLITQSDRTAPEHQCEWYLTPQGVLVSPSGNYLHEGNRLWRLLLTLLTRYRARQPLNGVVLAISAQDLLHQSPDEQYKQATALRKRLLELRRCFKINFPIYFMITKTDRLAGFSQFFSQFDGPELEQYWGMVFPWAASCRQPYHLQRDFDAGYEQLLYRLNSAMADTLVAERDLRLRAKIFAFPQAFAALRPLLLRYLSTVCPASDDEQTLMPRGLFFTSANQKTCVKSAGPARRDNVFDYGYAQENPVEEAPHTPPPQSYFLKALFREIILNEGGLAGLSFWSSWRRRLLSIAVCSGLLLSICATAGGCILSYYNNKLYLAEIDQRIAALTRQSAGMGAAHAPFLPKLLPFLDNLHQLARAEGIDVDRPPLAYRMGLYRGSQFANDRDGVYQHALKRLLLPLVAQQMQQVLYQADFSDIEFTYQALTAYEMLYEPQHYDGDFLRSWVIAALPAMPGASDLDDTQREQLLRHVTRLIVNDSPLRSPYAKDKHLESEAQNAIQEKTLARRAYHRLKNKLIHNHRFAGVSLADLAGGQVDLAFVRKSGMPVIEPVPGLFTPEGYWQGIDLLVGGEVDELLRQDHWVLKRTPSPDREDIIDQVRYLYINDFIQQWDLFLNDIGLEQTYTLIQRIDSMRIMSGEHSPLRQLLINVSRIVSLPASSADEHLADASEQFGHQTLRAFGQLFATTQEDKSTAAPEQLARNHFRDITVLACPSAAGNEGIVFDGIIKQLGGLYLYLSTLQNSGELSPQSGGPLAGLQADAMRLPSPFRQLVLALAEGANHESHRQTWQRLHQLFMTQIGGFHQFAISGRYPLTAKSAREISPDDLAHLFAPNTGLADRFFNQYLSDKVNTSDAEWHFLPWVPALDDAEEKHMLRFFQHAAYIRDALFRHDSRTPSFSFIVRPLTMDHRILSLELNLDGQTFDYNHGSSLTYHFNWPGVKRTGNARLTLTLADSTVKTIETSGPWALHRLLDLANTRWDSQSQASRVHFNIEGYRATLEITADSMRNPFTLTKSATIL
jgi:type VI secretion system protein ImpL